MADPSAPPRRLDVVLVVGGKYHDFDFARLELLKLLAEDARIRVRVFEDYEALAALAAADCLVSYTCDVIPSLPAQEALRDFVSQGGRWYALHGTNSLLRMMEDGSYGAPDWAPHFMETLGTMFVAHPPIAPYLVTVADPSHSMVADLAPFESDDELYLMDRRANLHVLLETAFGGEATGFSRSSWEPASHPVLYLRALGQGAVLYLTLGHCRGHYDMQPAMEYWPSVDRCAWNLPVFYTLLRRGLAWAISGAGSK